MDPTAESTWREYRQRKRAERLSEARQVWDAFEQAGGSEESVVAVDFAFIAPDRERAESLRTQLAENYTLTMEPAADGYWLAKGTTRPYGVTLSRAQHDAWVEFMCDVAERHGGVFSTWSVESPAQGISVSSENFEPR